VKSFSGPSRAGLMTTFYCLRFETPPTWRAKSPYLYPPGIGWPSYTLMRWVPFSSPPTTRRAEVVVLKPTSTRTAEKTSLVLFCALVGETCPQSCSLATAVVLFPVYTAVTWQWVYMSEHFLRVPELVLAVCCIQLNDEWCRAKRKRK
jgi:hypothetical protein